MKKKKLITLASIWGVSILLLNITSPTWLVEKAMSELNFEFSSKEAYVITVEIVRWIRHLYLVILTFFTFYIWKK